MKDDLLESKISFRITDDVKAYVQSIAKLECVTVSQFIRKLLFLDFQRRMRTDMERCVLQPNMELIGNTIEQELLPQSDAPSCTVLVRCVPEGGGDGV